MSFISVSYSKISWLISEALGPYFSNLNIEDGKKSSPLFPIHYNKQLTIPYYLQ